MNVRGPGLVFFGTFCMKFPSNISHKWDVKHLKLTELSPRFLTNLSKTSQIFPDLSPQNHSFAMAPSRGQLLISVFAPEGWPESVAPEYGRYQLWDTIQQAVFVGEMGSEETPRMVSLQDPTKGIQGP